MTLLPSSVVQAISPGRAECADKLIFKRIFRDNQAVTGGMGMTKSGGVSDKGADGLPVAFERVIPSRCEKALARFAVIQL